MMIDVPFYTPREDAKWEDIEYEAMAFSDERVDRYCNALKSIYANGSAAYAAFHATNRDDFISALHYDHRGPRLPLEILLTQAVVFPPFFAGDVSCGNLGDVEITSQGGCQFEGLLADVLLRGGAYEEWKGSVAEARSIAADAVAGMRSVGLEQLWSPFVIQGPWCSYFHDIAWDYTFAIQFPHEARWILLGATDTD